MGGWQRALIHTQLFENWLEALLLLHHCTVSAFPGDSEDISGCCVPGGSPRSSRYRSRWSSGAAASVYGPCVESVPSSGRGSAQGSLPAPFLCSQLTASPRLSPPLHAPAAPRALFVVSTRSGIHTASLHLYTTSVRGVLMRMRWLDGITDSMGMRLSKLGVGDGRGGLECCSPWGRKESDTTERLNWTELN